ncbi:MAG TPA: hypothetical protein PK760_02720 [Flavobacteriales bacterium]|nr:hypothetical protein [Flavobacteriales bacterium]
MIALFSTACDPDGPVGVEATEDLDITVERLDQDLFRAAPDSMASVSLKAYATYGEFYRVYIEQILQGAPVDDPRLPMVLHRFVLDPDWREAQNAVDSALGDMELQRDQFEGAFERLHALFPDSLIPRIVAFNSGYNFGVFPTDSVLGIGVEWFIGKDHQVISYLAPETFPQYVKDRMEPEMLVPSAVKGWLLVHYTKDIRGADVLTNLVETGKVMALLDALLPATEPHLKFAFSKDQLAWCEANEYMMWKDIVGKDQIFSTDNDAIGRLMNDAPFTNGFPHESPGHVGEWIGYRMVMAYLKENPKVTLPELLAMKDARVILKDYKPR